MTIINRYSRLVAFFAGALTFLLFHLQLLLLWNTLYLRDVPMGYRSDSLQWLSMSQTAVWVAGIVLLLATIVSCKFLPAKPVKVAWFFWLGVSTAGFALTFTCNGYWAGNMSFVGPFIDGFYTAVAVALGCAISQIKIF